ncbi:MAG: ComF family protein [Lachnospiraceae bacterium]|nr:ComF family protein [Lachnospiraceae bacterium]
MRLKIVWEFLLGLLFPERCPLCDEPVKTGEKGFCRECRKKLRIVGEGGKMKREHVAEVRVLYEYPSVAPAVYRFKYSGRKRYAAVFAKEIYDELGEVIKTWRADGIIAVPLHPKRLRKRGYNQAALLAKELSKYLGVPFYSSLVQRIKNTVPLKELNASERQNNLKKAFKMCQNDVKLNTIIIVDDIYTTGQTVEEMAKLLWFHGVKQIYVVALAGGSDA